MKFENLERNFTDESQTRISNQTKLNKPAPNGYLKLFKGALTGGRSLWSSGQYFSPPLGLNIDENVPFIYESNKDLE